MASGLSTAGANMRIVQKRKKDNFSMRKKKWRIYGKGKER
jgi:ADP-glucose pyrophosphorylase